MVGLLVAMVTSTGILLLRSIVLELVGGTCGFKCHKSYNYNNGGWGISGCVGMSKLAAA